MNNITAIVQCNEESAEDRLKLFSEVASVECAEKPPENLGNIISNVDTDFDEKTQNKLVSVISQVENSNSQPISDDFAVRMRIKDDTTFAFASRRFSQTKRNEIRKITDNLLQRGIFSSKAVSHLITRVSF